MSARGCVVTASLSLVVEECCRCGIVFAFPQELKDRAVNAGPALQFYCPQGHSQHYTSSRVKQLEESLGRAREALQASQARLDETRRERDHHWIERKKLKTRHKNLKTRVAHGVCPCCQRSFENLRRHIETKHPHYATTEEGGSK